MRSLTYLVNNIIYTTWMGPTCWT